MSSGEPMADHTAGQREPSAPSRGSVANHDAVPAATAPVDRLVRLGATDCDSVGTDKAEPLNRDCGTGNTTDRPQPVKDGVSDRPKPINDERLAALDELSATDQKLELEYGLTGNPMIKPQPCKAAKTDTTQRRNGTPAEGSVHREGTEPVAWALIATDGAIAGDVLAVTTTRELAFRKFVDSHQPCRIVPLIVAPQDCATAKR